MIKMCVFDVDGTLYDYYNHCIPQSTIQALKELQKNGIKIVVATGRCHYALGKALNDLNFDYVIGVNGAVIVDKEKKVLVRQDMSMDDVLKINAFCNETEAGLIWKFIDHMYVYQHEDKVDWYEGQVSSDIGKEPFIDCEEKNHHLIDLPQSCSLHAPFEKVKEAFANSNTIEFHQYSEDGFDFVCKGLNKGIGLTQLMKVVGVKKDEVVAFGDNYNDIPMFDVVSHKVVMGNGVDEVKKIATFITKSCDCDGIYAACKKLGLI